MPFDLTTRGSNAPKTAFVTLDPQGPRNGRDLSNVVNNAMQGKLNCIDEVEGALVDIQPGDDTVQIFDSRISPQSVVVTQAMSDAAAFLDWHSQGQGWVQFEVNSLLIDGLGASGSMDEPGEIYGPLPTGGVGTGTEIDFNTVGQLPLRLMEFSDANNSLLLHMAGVYQISIFMVADALSNNRTYYFDLKFDHSTHGVTYATFEYDSRTNTFIDDNKIGFADLDQDTTVTVEVRSSNADTITIECGVQLLRVMNSQLYANRVPPEIFTDDPYFRVRYAVIG